MRKLSGKLFIFLVLASAFTLLPGAAQACFDCYCNGDYVGCVTTITYCWNACQPQDQKGQSSLDALDPRVTTCNQETRDGEQIFSCNFDPASK